jgi:hypothetical protein
MNMARCAHGMSVYKGRVLVYGGDGVHGNMLSSVEMLSQDGSEWRTLPTPMFMADMYFSSVSLPDKIWTTTVTSTEKCRGTNKYFKKQLKTGLALGSSPSTYLPFDRLIFGQKLKTNRFINCKHKPISVRMKMTLEYVGSTLQLELWQRLLLDLS